MAAEHQQPAATRGRATKKAIVAAVRAHVAVLKGKPLRAAISESLAKEENLGGQERRFIAFATRELSRHQRYLDFIAKSRGQAPGDFQLVEDAAVVRFALWRQAIGGLSATQALAEVALPGPVRPRSVPDAVVADVLNDAQPLPEASDELDRLATRHSFPTWLAKAIEQVAPPGELGPVLEALNREPPLMLRVRPPGTRDEVRQLLAAKGIDTSPVLADSLLIADDSRAVFESGPMKNGRLIVMDEGSQRLCELTAPLPGQTVIDYCAGAGGKTIVLADMVGEHGRVMAHDISAKRLDEARRRVAQLKLRHVTFPKTPPVEQADVVLVDAPCSGTGTLAREPDQKWKLSTKRVDELVKTQTELLSTVARAVKVGASITYATCSLLRAENEGVVEAFLKAHVGFEQQQLLRVWPHQSTGGGFFGARLLRRR